MYSRPVSQLVSSKTLKVKINVLKTALMLGLFIAMQLILSVTMKGPNEYSSMVPFMDIEYTLNGTKNTSRIHFELFWDTTPKTAMNFARILEGKSVKKEKPISYKNTVFHRIIDRFMMQGGGFEYSEGTDEYPAVEYDKF